MKRYTIGLITLILTSSFAYGQDWPELGRYSENNKKYAQSSDNEDRVVFMGNSITEGWSTILPEFFKGKSYINRGISGQTTPQMLIRFRPDVIDLNPKVVIILAGINDIAENTGPSTVKMISDNIISMADLAKINGINVIIFVIGYPLFVIILILIIFNQSKNGLSFQPIFLIKVNGYGQKPHFKLRILSPKNGKRHCQFK
mgnify:CR=1 FL=1